MSVCACHVQKVVAIRVVFAPICFFLSGLAVLSSLICITRFFRLGSRSPQFPRRHPSGVWTRQSKDFGCCSHYLARLFDGAGLILLVLIYWAGPLRFVMCRVARFAVANFAEDPSTRSPLQTLTKKLRWKSPHLSWPTFAAFLWSVFLRGL